MEAESLAALKAAFDTWRRTGKRYTRDAVPADLLERARAAARYHGPTAVARAARVDRRRLEVARNRSDEAATVAQNAPTYSRIEVAVPTATTTRAFAEVELPTGAKVRLFTGSDEALGLLTALLGVSAGGAR
jgi:hypothetical protein